MSCWPSRCCSWSPVALRSALIANALLRITWVIVALGLGWAVLFLDTMRLARPVTMQRGHGVAVAGTAWR